jgi:phosphohistidine phosphatase SixA
MRACLTYHAEAVPRESNPSPRLLTDKGRADARRLGLFLKEDGMGNARVLHNGTTWIQENAEILGQALGGGDGERIEKPLYPLNAGADIGPLIRDLNAAEDDIVAALPSDVTFRTVTQLIAGRESPLAVSMENGDAVCLQRVEDGVWKINWLLTTRHLAAGFPDIPR